MKKIFFSFSLIMAGLAFGISANAVNVTITDGIDNSEVKYKIENGIARILNEVNAAQRAGRDLNFSAMGHLSQRVQQSMASLWENTPFICTDDEIVEHGITTGTGYQIRNIPLMMKPKGDREFNEDEYQEAVISFDRQGNVESFYFCISMNLYMNVIKSNLELTDLRRRQLILDYVEQFRTAYNQKDINFLNQVFSDDALIITGNVITQKHPEGFLTQKVRYNKQNKEQYIRNLRALFKRNSYIHVSFDEIEVMRHPTNPNFYGVTLLQGWTSGRGQGHEYSDKGYLFLLWDFRNEYAPEIHVRTWQPDKIAGKPIAKEDVFSLSDFDIQ